MKIAAIRGRGTDGTGSVPIAGPSETSRSDGDQAMALRRIFTYPEPVLKRRAVDVRNLTAAEAALIEDMVETMYAAPGIGLAAPQVGVSQRIIVLDIDHERPGGHLLRIVNPVIVERDDTIVWEEGCLSVPDFTAEVTRAGRVLVTGWSLDEKEIAIEARGLLAVALQHEIDHLEGKLFLDRISRLKRDLYKRRMRKIERQGKPPPPSRPPI
jgi:peptide deformylase